MKVALSMALGIVGALHVRAGVREQSERSRNDHQPDAKGAVATQGIRNPVVLGPT